MNYRELGPDEQIIPGDEMRRDSIVSSSVAWEPAGDAIGYTPGYVSYEARVACRFRRPIPSDPCPPTQRNTGCEGCEEAEKRRSGVLTV